MVRGGPSLAERGGPGKGEAAPGNFSIVAVDAFVRATRDSGYKGTPSAVAELLDNALQAGAQRIQVTIDNDGDDEQLPMRLSVRDDGAGMDPFTLRTALRFGGSSRFDDRQGIGRYGMGLPNSSASQARRVTVYSWQRKGEVYSTWLDLDLVASGAMVEVPTPRRVSHPGTGDTPTGTLVVWSRCDRLDNRRPSTVAQKLTSSIGRRFRYFIWDGVQIAVNGRTVQAMDPLCLHEDAVVNGATLFDASMQYEVEIPVEVGSTASVGVVTVRFSELPVHAWGGLSNEEKRRLGVTKGAGVSVVRAGREVDYGWFFMGAKRMENYDDWWRCEVRFDPVLDEMFGISHTKQQIRPAPWLVEALSPDLEQVARALNARARAAHLAVKTTKRTAPAIERAERAEPSLPPLPTAKTGAAISPDIQRRLAPGREDSNSGGSGLRYGVVEAVRKLHDIYSFQRAANQLVLLVNPDHPFHRAIYKRLAEATDQGGRDMREALELTLLAAARAEAAADPRDASVLEAFRRRWSDTLAAYLTR